MFTTVSQPKQPMIGLPQARFGFTGLRPATMAALPPVPGDSYRARFGVQDNLVPLIRKQGKATHVLTFRGLADPIIKQPPALQTKVRGVTRYQKGPLGNITGPVGDLASSNWKDGQELSFKAEGRNIYLVAPGFGPIGRIPDEISKTIAPMIARNPDQFRIELSNVIAGTSKGASTIGLRVNIIYMGNDPKQQEKVRDVFNRVLNNPACKDSAMFYQALTTPEQALALILRHEEVTKGKAAARQMEKVINNVAGQLKDPNNKRILLLGHCKPDGDTLGCTAGLYYAIKLMDPSRVVDCAVDDRIPGLFRDKDKLGMEVIKRPPDPEKLKQIEQKLIELRHKLANPTGLPGDSPKLLQGQIKMLEQERAILSDPGNLLPASDENNPYDLVVTMDIPSPTRFTDKFKPYLENAKNVIYIDHHPHRFNEWDAAKDWTGLDIAKTHQNDLAWVADAVGACAQMMTILGNRLVPQFSQIAEGKIKVREAFPLPEQQQALARYVGSLITGMWTDTGSYTRTANLTPDDLRNPVEQRPNFQPEGVAKWLMNLTKDLKDQRVDKKWLRENVTYGISDEAYDLAVKYALAGKIEHPGNAFGIVQVDYEQMNAVWQLATEQDGAVTLLDIQNEFKYGNVMSDLRGNSAQDRNRIAVLICQDKKKGRPDEKGFPALDNGLRLSIRSGYGTQHAELIASLFGGGGHGAAAGARIDLPGIELNTPLGIEINGRPAANMAEVLAVLEKNLDIQHDGKLSHEQKKKMVIPIAVVADAQGKPVAGLLSDLVSQIRANNKANPDGQVLRFAGKPATLQPVPARREILA